MADALLAGVAGTIAGFGLQQTLNHCSPNRDQCEESFATAAMILGGAVFLAAGASAFHGFHQINRCVDSRTSWCGTHDCESHDAGPATGR